MEKIKVSEVILVLKNNGIFKEAKLSNGKGLDESKVIQHLSYSSLDVTEDTLFFCKGQAFKKEYLVDAMTKGAVGYISEEPIISDAPYILVTDMRKALSVVSTAFYDDIWNKKLNMVGVTGTKGKTTTTFYIKSILDAYCESMNKTKCGLLTGEYTFDGKNKQESGLTTPETFELHRHLAACCENDCSYMVMETSSQALKYGRTDGLNYKVAVFTNLGEDHISDIEHPTMEDYLDSKMKIFRQAEIACIGTDMEEEIFNKAKAEATKQCKEIITFGTKESADVYGYDMESTLETLSFKVKYNGTETKIDANMGGFYNAKNILGAIAVAIKLGVPMDIIKEGVFKGKAQGRLEVFNLPNKKDVKLIFDYAHNEISYEALFGSINQICPGRKKIFVFGLTGDRAYSRRKFGGMIADREADRVVLTQVTPGSEDPYNICCEIKQYISEDKDVSIIVDRKEAIKYAMDTVEDGWLIVFIGFSSPYSQKIDGKFVKVPSDLETVKEYIKSHK